MPKLSITKVFRFAASHSLPNHQGLCKNLHGHSYQLEVTVSGLMDADDSSASYGMIADFGDVKKVIEEKVINKLDHSHLNDSIENPTAENIVLWIAAQLDHCELWPRVTKIKLWEEMGKACCTWEV